jgi:hypothetical protein
MATVLVLGSLLGLLGVLVFGVVAIVKRADPVARRRWNGWVLGSLALGLVCLAPFLLGVKIG